MLPVYTNLKYYIKFIKLLLYNNYNMNLLDRLADIGIDFAMDKGLVSDPNLGKLALYNPGGNPITKRSSTYQNTRIDECRISNGTYLAKISARNRDRSGYFLNGWKINCLENGIFPRGIQLGISPLDIESRAYRPGELEAICDNAGVQIESIEKGDYALQLPGCLIADSAKLRMPIKTLMMDITKYSNGIAVESRGYDYGTYTPEDFANEAFKALFPMEKAEKFPKVSTHSDKLVVPRIMIARPSE